MTASTLALQQAIFAKLTALAPLTTLLGGPRIYADVPHPVAYPYLTFGQSTLRDASTSTEAGDEHLVTLHVWSRGRGRAETQAIIALLRTALHDQPLILTGHHLVNLRADFADARRDPDGETIHGTLRLRAVTEPI